MSLLTSAKRIIVKTGSALIADGDAPRHKWLAALASDIAALRRNGQQVILVSSGAVALGRSALSVPPITRLDQKQAAAAIGQPRLIASLQNAFDPHGITVAQSLLTLADTERRRRWLNARATLETLLESNILPVINENDTVATDEIRYGDNDRLAARVAQMMCADTLILLTDVDGLYTANPASDPNAQHIPHIRALTAEHDAMASGAASDGVGSGGMSTKLTAARIAYDAGCATIITRGDRSSPLGAINTGALCTVIQPSMTPANARAVWLKGHLDPQGTIIVDTGAAKAIASGASLLAVGMVSVSGQFERGDAITIEDTNGNLIAKGVTAYSAGEVSQVVGLKSDAVEAVLGYRGRPAIIHRDDMVLV